LPRDYYHLCCKYKGRPVELKDKLGNVHRGIIERVTPTHVYIRPYQPYGPRNLRGFGYGGFGRPFFGRRFGFGFGAAAVAIALAALIAFAVIPFGFFW
jgi:hypothetical protein